MLRHSPGEDSRRWHHAVLQRWPTGAREAGVVPDAITRVAGILAVRKPAWLNRIRPMPVARESAVAHSPYVAQTGQFVRNAYHRVFCKMRTSSKICRAPADDQRAGGNNRRYLVAGNGLIILTLRVAFAAAGCFQQPSSRFWTRGHGPGLAKATAVAIA